jgi:hypothetical protein
MLFGAIVLGVFAAPSVARADDPFGAGGLLGEADAAIAQAQALAPQEPQAQAPQNPARSFAEAPSSTAATPAAAAASATAATASTQATAVVDEVLNASRSLPSPSPAASPSGAPLPLAAQPGAGRRGAQARRHHARAHRPKPKSSARSARASGLSTSSSYVAQRVILVSSTMATTRSHVVHGSPAQAARGKAAVGAVPQRLPPAPLPPQSLSSSGQGGGQGQLVPLLVGALSAALLLAVFEFLSRVLPRTAFRKPRRLLLRPWHPG